MFTSCPANQSITLAAGQSTAIATWEPATATDNSGITPSITYSNASGSTFGIGTTEIKCSAIDQSGNTEICYFQIEIIGEYINCSPPKKKNKQTKKTTILRAEC